MIRQKKRTVKANVAKAVEGVSDRMIRDVARYLELNGWSVIVAGPAFVQHRVGDRKFNYEFVLPFTGSHRSKQTTERH